MLTNKTRSSQVFCITYTFFSAGQDVYYKYRFVVKHPEIIKNRVGHKSFDTSICLSSAVFVILLCTVSINAYSFVNLLTVHPVLISESELKLNKLYLISIKKRNFKTAKIVYGRWND